LDLLKPVQKVKPFSFPKMAPPTSMPRFRKSNHEHTPTAIKMMKHILKYSDVNQKMLGVYFGVHFSTVSQWMRHNRVPAQYQPKLHTLYDMAIMPNPENIKLSQLILLDDYDPFATYEPAEEPIAN
jgi:DNA-binding transcriptional regulator YiaG